MRVVLLAAAGLVAAAAITTPAAAQSGAAAGFSGSSGVNVHRGGEFRGFDDGFRHDRRRHVRRGDDDVFILDREYQGDTAWRANSYNDWWHERPHRSHPAWMSRNQNCERMYWSGGGWRC